MSNSDITRRQFLKQAGLAGAAATGLACLSADPASAASEGKTIWFVRMPDEPPRKELPSSKEIEDFLTRQPLVDNSQTELEQNTEFASNVLGQHQFLSDIARFYQKARLQGFEVRVRFVPWDRALWEIKRRYQDYVVDRNDVMVIQVPSSWSASFAAQGILLDLSAQIDKSKFLSSTLNWYTWDGKLVAIPDTVDLRLCIFRRGLLDSADFHSRNSFLSACDRAKQKFRAMGKKHSFVLGVPTGEGFDSFIFLMIWLWNSGLKDIVSLEDRAGIPWKEAHLDGEQAKDAVRLLTEMRWKGYLDAPNAPTRKVADDFLDGKYAMVVLGPWIVKRALERRGITHWTAGDLEAHWKSTGLEMALPPDLGAGSRVTFEGGSGLGICASPKADQTAISLALSFLQNWTSVESQIQHAEVTGLLPANTGAQKRSPLFRLIQKQTNWTPGNSRIYPVIPEWGPYVEQIQVVDNLDGFWHVLNAIPPGGGTNQVGSLSLSGSKEMLVGRLVELNQAINDFLTPGKWPQIQTELRLQQNELHVKSLELERARIRIYLAMLLSAAFSLLIVALGYRHKAERERAKNALEHEQAERQRIEQEANRKRIEAELQANVAQARQEALRVASGMAAHRLRNVLPVISGRISRTLEKGKAIGEGIEWCRIALDETRRAQGIVSGFRDFARSLVYDRPDTLVGEELVQRLGEVAKQSIRRPDTEVDVHAEPGLPAVQVNLSRLSDDIINFVHDSERHKPSALRIALSGALSNGDDRQELGFKPGAPYLRLVYTDNGPGIPVDKKQWIFEPFRTTEAEGTGLGLAIAMRDARIHGGALVECGQPGSGVRFELYLPAAPSRVKGGSENG